MSEISVFLEMLTFTRDRTLLSLQEVRKASDPMAWLAYRPGVGRATLGWQLMHIGVTEELFATERIFGRATPHAELAARFKGGSQADDDTPTLELIDAFLSESRMHLVSGVQSFSDSDLVIVPEAFKERGWSLRRILQTLVWHEAHHQGQLHALLNTLKAATPKA